MNTVISQALATGLPVVATRHSGFPEQVMDDKNGFLAEEGDPNSIADAIVKFFEVKADWPKMGHAAREHALRYYDQKTLIDEQLRHYRELIKNSRTGAGIQTG
jgi:colanic acid/amylovoran biosynthesis glycosyltransferase